MYIELPNYLNYMKDKVAKWIASIWPHNKACKLEKIYFVQHLLAASGQCILEPSGYWWVQGTVFMPKQILYVHTDKVIAQSH